MKTVLVILSLAFCSSINAEQKEWKLVWADEFNVDGKPDPKNWVYENGFVRNHELQWYQPDNAYCVNGKLVIEARRERKPNPHYKKGSKKWQLRRPYARYTSSSLKTHGLHAWQYGRFEVRAKIIAQTGLWPAIWFLGEHGEWPSCGEIDLMEYYGGNILANACWESNKQHPIWDKSETPVSKLGTNWDQQFHVWRMDWNAKTIKLYLNDRLLNTIELSKTHNRGGRGLKNPFHQPHHILLNLAIGGRCGGNPSKTTFPSRFEIDYVRVYQRR
ncbi:MAG: glycoside hydrolase family 16 protein [Verrucomicrobiae bacterium]|nr:glycoside hydrolase family 16 protein [Verrucomicrobiae bacterium]NNJ85853.1 glycoside hydrolase family 16 protein [Akkermansiaceae bacterium]